MLSVLASADAVERRIERFGDRLSVGAVNGPSSVLVSGDADAVDEFQAECEAEQLRVRRFAVDGGMWRRSWRRRWRVSRRVPARYRSIRRSPAA
jgi:hypothetical protein